MSTQNLEKTFDRERLLRAVCRQQLVCENRELAGALIEVGQRLGFPAGTWLYKKGDTCQGIYFILHGIVELNHDGNSIAQLTAKQQIGTWPVLYSDPTYDVGAQAIKDTVALRIGERQFRDVGDRYPVLWVNLARTQADRLKQSNENILPKHPVPRMLIGSSSEQLTVARKLKSLLIRSRRHDIEVDLWTDVFPAGESTLESLTTGLDDWDFAVFFLTPDDKIISREVTAPAPRDNIVFEAGLCMGRMGRRRTLLLRPGEPKNLKRPSDLSGITLLIYIKGPDEIVDDICSRVDELGSRVRVAIDRLA